VVELKVGEKAGLGTFAFSVAGRAKHEEHDYASLLCRRRWWSRRRSS